MKFASSLISVVCLAATAATANYEVNEEVCVRKLKKCVRKLKKNNKSNKKDSTMAPSKPPKNVKSTKSPTTTDTLPTTTTPTPPTQSPTDVCGCYDDGDGPIEKVPASGTSWYFQDIVTNYLEGDVSSSSSRVTYGNKIGCWDVSLVTNMHYAFFYQRTFDEPIGCWNVSSVTTMWGMFDGANAFNQDIGAWDVSLVTEMRAMFYFADVFDQNLCSWNIQANAYTTSMFYASNCPNKDAPSASAKCQSCDRRLAATATAITIDAAGKPNKPTNSNSNNNKN